jgi:signal peptidase I
MYQLPLPSPLQTAVRELGGLRELVGILIIGLSPLWVGFFASQFVSAYAIPSHSMDGTLKVGDVVLAEKVSPKLRLPLERGDIIFFRPPAELSEIVADTGGRIGSRDLFVKRVAGVAGDNVRIDEETGGQTILIDG